MVSADLSSMVDFNIEESHIGKTNGKNETWIKVAVVFENVCKEVESGNVKTDSKIQRKATLNGGISTPVINMQNNKLHVMLHKVLFVCKRFIKLGLELCLLKKPLLYKCYLFKKNFFKLPEVYNFRYCFARANPKLWSWPQSWHFWF